jgi:hypothetical protein
VLDDDAGLGHGVESLFMDDRREPREGSMADTARRG